MSHQSTVALADGRRALLTGCMAVLMLAFNADSIGTAPDAAVAVAVYLAVGYPALTAIDLLFDRLLWAD